MAFVIFKYLISFWCLFSSSYSLSLVLRKQTEQLRKLEGCSESIGNVRQRKFKRKGASCYDLLCIFNNIMNQDSKRFYIILLSFFHSHHSEHRYDAPLLFFSLKRRMMFYFGERRDRKREKKRAVLDEKIKQRGVILKGIGWKNGCWCSALVLKAQ